MPNTKSRQLLKIEKEYRLETGSVGPVDPHLVAAWAIKTRRWEAHAKSLINQCAREIASALRNVYFTDAKGRRVRAKHSVKISRNGAVIGLWDDIRTATRTHIDVSFKQRREQIVGDCRQLKTDVDSYNDSHPDEGVIQLVLDFTMDVAELEAAKNVA